MEAAASCNARVLLCVSGLIAAKPTHSERKREKRHRKRERERTFLVDGWEAEDEVLGATVVLRTTDLVHRKKNFD